MRKNIQAFKEYQVFLNYPFDEEFSGLADAMSFAVVAGGLIPVCAYDSSVPDQYRLEKLVNAIRNCQYSAHDLSRSSGSGPKNLSRMNMPIEMGMALFYALDTQRKEHRCFFFVPPDNAYREFASNLAGLDPEVHNNNEERVLSYMFEWLRGVFEPESLFNKRPTINILEKYDDFKKLKKLLKGSGENGSPSHEETRELMYVLCADCGWWDIRGSKIGMNEFPPIPLLLVLNESKSVVIDQSKPTDISSNIREALSCS